MMGEVYNKYKEHFNYFIIYFVLAVIFELAIAYFDLNNIIGINMDTVADVKNFIKFEIIALILFLGLIEIFIFTYGLIISKRVINEDYLRKEDFSDIFHYLPRIFVIDAFFSIIIIIGFLLYIFFIFYKLKSLGSKFLFAFLGLIILVIISVLTTPINNYLVYTDEKIIPSIKEGIKLGKKYFSKILGVNFIAALIGALANIPIAKESLIVLAIVKLFVYMYAMYINLYIMNLCKIEEPKTL